MIKWRIAFIILVFVLSACKTNSDNDKKTSQTGDSLQLQASTKDSGKKYQSNPEAAAEDQEPSAQQVMAELVDMDKKVQVIDSTVLLGLDTFSIKLTHRCLHDSGVAVPIQYLKPYGLKEFVTHNFVSDILIKRNDSIIVNRVVSKNDFGKVEEGNLLKYGILVYPYIGKVNKDKQQITIAYSLSIPLTDVGQSVRAVVNRNGTIEFKSDGAN
jgi:hypothetical protein